MERCPYPTHKPQHEYLPNLKVGCGADGQAEIREERKKGDWFRWLARRRKWRYLFWLRGMDLNHRPLGYEPNELPDCSTPHSDSSAGLRVRQTLAADFLGLCRDM